MQQDRSIPAPVVDRAIRLTYAQMMSGAVFGASTGGMFLIGFALALGADNRLLGLLSSAPMFFVVAQMLSAWAIERGASCKRVTVLAAFTMPLCWLLISAIPLGARFMTGKQPLFVLIAVTVLATIAGQFAGNARASWIGELIPAERRGRFFGMCALFAGIVGAVFAVGEGRFLDFVRDQGLFAFAALFLFGSFFGLISASLNLPQPDVFLQRGESRSAIIAVRDVFGNRPLVILIATQAVMNLGVICAPFVPAYSLRDVGMSFFGLGCLNAVFIATMLAASPFLGRLIDRIGSRPVLIAGLLLAAPLGLIWVFIPPGRADLAYRLLPFTNAISGVAHAAINVAISTMIYKITTSRGRSIQLAVYGICVTLAAAPMPMFGGWLVTALQQTGYPVDLRLTFYLWTVAVASSVFVAVRLPEPGSMPVRTLMFSYFPQWLASRPAFIAELPVMLMNLWMNSAGVSPKNGTTGKPAANGAETERPGSRLQ